MHLFPFVVCGILQIQPHPKWENQQETPHMFHGRFSTVSKLASCGFSLKPSH